MSSYGYSSGGGNGGDSYKKQGKPVHIGSSKSSKSSKSRPSGQDRATELFYMWICHRCKTQMSWITESKCSNTNCDHAYCEENCRVVARPVNLTRDRTPEGWRNSNSKSKSKKKH